MQIEEGGAMTPLFLAVFAFAIHSMPQNPVLPAGGPRPVAVVSPEVAADRHITFRLLAPQAQAVRLTASDIPCSGQTLALTKGESGVWSVTIGPVDPGAYR